MLILNYQLKAVHLFRRHLNTSYVDIKHFVW